MPASPRPLPLATPAPLWRDGTGEPLVLLHGITCSWRIWRPVLRPLAAHFDVVAPTLPGHRGGPSVPDGDLSITQVADGIERILDDAGIETAHLAGNSLGGWLAIELGRRGRARSVCALSPAGAWAGPRELQRLIRVITNASANLRRVHPLGFDRLMARPGARRAVFRLAMEHGERIPPQDAVDMLADVLECDLLVGFGNWVRTARSLTAATAEQDYPITIAWAEHDRTIPYDAYGVPLLAVMAGAREVSLRDVGHVPMYDDPRLVVDTILESARAASAAAAA